MKGGDVVVGIHFQLGFHRGIPILLFFVSSACQDGIYIIYKDLIPRNSSLDNNRNSFTNELLSIFSKCEEELEKKMLQNEEETRNPRYTATGLGDKWGISCSLVEEKGIRRAKSEKS